MHSMILHPLGTVNDLALHPWKSRTVISGEDSILNLINMPLVCLSIIIGDYKLSCELSFATEDWPTFSLILLQEVSACSTQPFVHMIDTFLLLNCHRALYLLLLEAVESVAIAVTQRSCVSVYMFLQ